MLSQDGSEYGLTSIYLEFVLNIWSHVLLEICLTLPGKAAAAAAADVSVNRLENVDVDVDVVAAAMDGHLQFICIISRENWNAMNKGCATVSKCERRDTQ